MKTKKFNLFIVVVLSLTILTSCFVSMFLAKSTNVYADSVQSDIVDDGNIDEETEGEVQPRLFTSLSISINGGDGKVWATVKNDFTLFPSTVIVVVMLYASETYAESYTQMTLISSNQTYDLDMGHTVVTEASTGGVAKYWIARMRYKIDQDAWASKTTGVCKIGANGEFLGYI